jgi:DNA-binding MarR family transcriptional regulator
VRVAVFGRVGATVPSTRSTAEAITVMVALRRIIRFVRLADRETESAHGLSAAQLFVLASLAASPAGSVAELAARTLTDQSSVSTVVSRLVAKRLIKRTVAAADRRRVELRLTAAGARLVGRSPRVFQVKLIETIDAMPKPRRRALAGALDQLVGALGATDVEPQMFFEDEPKVRRKQKR